MKIYNQHLALPELGRWLAAAKPHAHTAVAVVLEWRGRKAPIWLTEPQQMNIILAFLSEAMGADGAEANLFVIPNGSLVLTALAMPNRAYQATEECFRKIAKEMVQNQPDATTAGYDLSIHWEPFFASCKRINTHQLEAPEKPSILANMEAMLRNIRRNPQMASHKPTTLSVLFVEDDPSTRQLITHLIADQNVKLLFAANGAEAVAIYCAHLPHIVFLDIELPDVNGLEILDLLTRYDPAAYVVMLTGNAQQRNVEFALQKGIRGFISKPFNRQKILDNLERFRKTHTS